MYIVFTIGRASKTQEYLVLVDTDSKAILGSPQTLLELLDTNFWFKASAFDILDKYYKLTDPYEISSKEELLAHIKMLRIL